MNGPQYAVLEVTGGYVVRDWVYRCSRVYNLEDAHTLLVWMRERAAGYPPSRELVENPRF